MRSEETTTLAVFAVFAGILHVQGRLRRFFERATGSVALRPIGKSGVAVSVIGQGGAALGELNCEISDADGTASLTTAHELGVTLFDTAPWYGLGLSEMRMGLGLHRLPRDSYVLSTKVGRWLVPDPAERGYAGWAGGLRFRPTFEYTASAFDGQHANSLQRMGLGRIDALVIHDLEPHFAGQHAVERGLAPDTLAGARHHLKSLATSGFGQLQQMRADGVIRAFGAGLNSPMPNESHAAKMKWNREYLDALLKMGEGSAHGHLDFMLIANLYTLIHHEGLELLDECARRGVSVIIGGPYASGILATGVLAQREAGGAVGTCAYMPASTEVVDRVGAIEAVCRAHGVPLRAAALQFPHAHPAVVSVIPGGKTAAEVASNVQMMNESIPSAFWRELKAKGLVPKHLPSPDEEPAERHALGRGKR